MKITQKCAILIRVPDTAVGPGLRCILVGAAMVPGLQQLMLPSIHGKLCQGPRAA